MTSRIVSPEDVTRGDYVAVVRETIEVWPWWHCAEPWSEPTGPVAISYVPIDESRPMKVIAVSAPFVLVKTVRGKTRTIDVRRETLARLAPEFGRTAWKRYRAQHKTKARRQVDQKSAP